MSRTLLLACAAVALLVVVVTAQQEGDRANLVDALDPYIQASPIARAHAAELHARILNGSPARRDAPAKSPTE
jgi:hypothetical protein